MLVRHTSIIAAYAMFCSGVVILPYSCSWPMTSVRHTSLCSAMGGVSGVSYDTNDPVLILYTHETNEFWSLSLLPAA